MLSSVRNMPLISPRSFWFLTEKVEVVQEVLNDYQTTEIIEKKRISVDEFIYMHLEKITTQEHFEKFNKRP